MRACCGGVQGQAMRWLLRQEQYDAAASASGTDDKAGGIRAKLNKDKKSANSSDATSTPPAVRILSYSQPDLRAKLEQAVQCGYVVLVEGVGHTIDPWMDTILTKQVGESIFTLS